MASDESSQQLDLSINFVNQGKILKLTFKNLETFSDKISIDRKICEEVQEFLKNLNEENFPHAFVICVELKNEKANSIEKLKKEIDEKFQNFCPLLVQINSKNFLRRQKENLKEVEVNLDSKVLIKDSKISDEDFVKFLIDEKFQPKILFDIQELHENIKSGKLQGVKKFCENYPTHKLCYGLSDFCALEFAIKCGQLKIFSFLRAKGFYTENGSELEDKISKLSTSQKREIRLENLKYVKENPEAFIGILTSKCKFDALSPISSSDVQEMLSELSRNESLKPFLQIASQADFKVVFDFSKGAKNISKMVPGNSAMGIAYYNRGELYIGADREKFPLYGTFMHELTHLVLFLIYENRCLPYCEDDKEKEEKWTKILEDEKKNLEKNPENVEEIIKLVFNYTPGVDQQLELAVRPNHIMARFLDNPEKITELQKSHVGIFDYLQNFVLSDLKISNIFRLIKLNNEFKVVESAFDETFELSPSNAIEILGNERKNFVLTSNVLKFAISKLFDEIKKSSKNKIDAKVKNIFVDVEKMKQKFLREEFFDLIENSKIDRIIFDASEVKNVEEVKKLLKEFSEDFQIILICNEESCKSFEYEKVHKTFFLKDLRYMSQYKLRKKEIKFQGKSFEAENIFGSISDEILALLVDKKEIWLNPVNSQNLLNNFFIPRTILKVSVPTPNSHSEILNFPSIEFKFEDFLKEIQSEKIILISNIAGSGKTTLLKKIYETFLEEFPEHWISFVSLIDHVEELSKNSNEKLTKVLGITKVEEKIFSQKLAKGEVKILFDGFDEISPKCKFQTLEFFKLFKVQSKNQIFITTRTHLEQDIESELGVKAFRLKNLPKNDQIEFLCDFWKSSNDNQNFIKECAQNLVRKISEIVKDFPDLIGIPLIIQSVAKIFVNKIDENFPNELKNLKLSMVYEKIMEEFLNILATKFPQNLLKNAYKRSGIILALEFLTIVHFYDENFANSLGFSHDESEWSLEEISRCGILTYDSETKKVKFNHETYGEFFLATILQNILKNFNELSTFQIELLKRILTSEKFKITRMFLNEIIEDVKRENPKLFKNEENLKIFEFLTDENFLNIFKFLMYSNLNEFPKFGEKIEEILCKASKNFESGEVFGKLLEEVQNYFKENFFENFLLKPKVNGSTIFENLAKELKEKNLRKLLLVQNEEKETLLHFNVENFENFQKVLKVISKSASKETQKELIKVKNEDGQNVLMVATFKNEIFLKILLEFVENLMDESEIEKLLCEIDNDDYNILHIAALNLKSEEIFELLWKKISKNVQNPKEFFMRKGQFDRNSLQLSAQNENGSEIFPAIFKLATSFCDSDEEVKNLIFDRTEENHNLLTLSICLATKPNLKFFLDRIFEIFKKDVKEILKTLRGPFGRNILSLMAGDNKDKDSAELLWKVLEENLSSSEILELLYDKDDQDNNVLHCAAYFSKSKEVVELLCKKIFEKFKNDQESLRKYLKLGGICGRNVLLNAIRGENENSFFYIFENIFENFFNFKDFMYEREEDGEHFLRWLVRYGSVSMLEFSFKKLERKFSSDELKNYLKMENENFKNNILHSAAYDQKNLDALKFSIAKVEKILGKNELKELMKHKERVDYLPLHCAIEFNTFEVFEFFAKLYERNFTKVEVKNLLEAKDFMQMANNNKFDKNMEEKVKKFHQKICED